MGIDPQMLYARARYGAKTRVRLPRLSKKRHGERDMDPCSCLMSLFGKVKKRCLFSKRDMEKETWTHVSMSLVSCLFLESQKEMSLFGKETWRQVFFKKTCLHVYVSSKLVRGQETKVQWEGIGEGVSMSLFEET